MRFYLFLYFGMFSLAHGLIGQTILIKNSSSIERENESIIINRYVLEKKIGKSLTNKIILLYYSNGQLLPCQQDDINQDNTWDELAFQVKIAAKSTIPLELKISNSDSLVSYNKLTQSYLGVSRKKDGIFQSVKKEIRPLDHIAQSRPMLYQYEGIGWENDKVGFRSYFDSRNGKDIFGKTTTKMVLDSIGLPGKDYHELSDWGMDILKVGNSLGAGALALYKDTLIYRLGETTNAEYNQIANGPIRSIIKLKYTGWKIGTTIYDVEEYISIWAGNYYYKSSVTISGKKLEGNLASGIVTLKNYENNKNTFSPNKTSECIYSFAKQSEHNDLLGLGILYSKKNRALHLDIPKKESSNVIGSTYCVVFKTHLNVPVEFIFFAGWEKSSLQFNSEVGFKSYIKQEACKINNPVRILIR